MNLYADVLYRSNHCPDLHWGAESAGLGTAHSISVAVRFVVDPAA